MSLISDIGLLILAVATLPVLLANVINEDKHNIPWNLLMVISIICSASAVVLFTINLIKVIEKL